MANLISPGVSVTITNSSFYIPAAAPTVPLLFVATRANKFQPDGVTLASGTAESGVVRAVTSIGQSIQLYGTPYFWEDSSGSPFYGDARNEYGIFALNQFLGIGNLAYVVRANIDLTDAATSFIGIGIPVADDITRVGIGNGVLGSVGAASAFVQPETISVVMTSNGPNATYTVQGSISGIIGAGVTGIPFTSNKVNFTIADGSIPFSADDYFQFDLVYAPTSYTGTNATGANSTTNGEFVNLIPLSQAVSEIISVVFTSPTTYTVSGSVTGPLGTGTVGSPFTDFLSHITFTIDGGSTSYAAGDEYQIALSQINLFNPLGANDAAKRVAITTALKAAINSNNEVRSEIYEYNLILAPGYWECATDLLALSSNIADEAFVIADAPSNKSPEQVANWAVTSDRASGTNVAYYYPWGLASNLDGKECFVSASGIALRTYAYSDLQSYVWMAPAGANRGVVTGVGKVGYASGTIGTANTFVEANLNQGQRDNLYASYKNINPITYFPGQGLIVFGQKTSAPVASALDRVNVVRLLMYVKRQLRKGSFPFLFEPNDKITRDNLKASADSFLNDILTKRGLYDFATLCDTSNNTPAVIDRNELIMDVAVKPMKAVEFIYIPINVVSTGASI
jgi:hypothetical protein